MRDAQPSPIVWQSGYAVQVIAESIHGTSRNSGNQLRAGAPDRPLIDPAC
jgi:hypothetical protein